MLLSRLFLLRENYTTINFTPMFRAGTPVEQSAHTVSSEMLTPVRRNLHIYLWKEDIEDGASVMTVEYRPVEYGKDYDVVNNPDIFELYIDGKEVKE